MSHLPRRMRRTPRFVFAQGPGSITPQRSSRAASRGSETVPPRWPQHPITRVRTRWPAHPITWPAPPATRVAPRCAAAPHHTVHGAPQHPLTAARTARNTGSAPRWAATSAPHGSAPPAPPSSAVTRTTTVGQAGTGVAAGSRSRMAGATVRAVPRRPGDRRSGSRWLTIDGIFGGFPVRADYGPWPRGPWKAPARGGPARRPGLRGEHDGPVVSPW